MRILRGVCCCLLSLFLMKSEFLLDSSSLSVVNIDTVALGPVHMSHREESRSISNRSISIYCLRQQIVSHSCLLDVNSAVNWYYSD